MSRKTSLKKNIDFELLLKKKTVESLPISTAQKLLETSASNQLIRLFRTRLLKNGKGSLARRILQEAFEVIQDSTGQNGFDVLRQAVLNVTPVVEVKPQRRGGSVFQVPVEVTSERGTLLALSWLAQAARQRTGRGMSQKLATELLEAEKKTGNAVRKKEELHRIAEANKALSHFRF